MAEPVEKTDQDTVRCDCCIFNANAVIIIIFIIIIVSGKF